MQVIRNLFRKNRFQEGDILYLQRHERKTLIHLTDRRVITTYEPLKNVMTELSSDVFESINKGIVVNHAFVDRDVDGYVLLRDGSGFSRRKKPLKKAKSSDELTDEERFEQGIRLLASPSIRVEAMEEAASRGSKQSAWNPDGTFRASTVFEDGNGHWLEVEFSPKEQRVFSPESAWKQKRK